MSDMEWTISRESHGRTYYTPLPRSIMLVGQVATQIMKWYNRTTRDWVVSYADESGNQVGSSSYVYSADEADAEALYLRWKALRDAGPRCESGWTGDRCSLPQDHEGPHNN